MSKQKQWRIWNLDNNTILEAVYNEKDAFTMLDFYDSYEPRVKHGVERETMRGEIFVCKRKDGKTI